MTVALRTVALLAVLSPMTAAAGTVEVLAACGGYVQRLRVADFELLPPAYFSPPEEADVFFDPEDTRAAAYAALDSLVPDDRVLVLGSGSGAEARVARNAGALVHGIDVSPAAVRHARRTYADARLTFALGDYRDAATTRLLEGTPPGFRPTVLAANPPYVPGDPELGTPTMYGGRDGLDFMPSILRHAQALNVRALALTVGSYTSPREVAERLVGAGFRIRALTLTPVRFGAYSLRQQRRIFEQERAGRAILWRPDAGTPGYILVSISAERGTIATGLTPDRFVGLLRAAAASRTTALEAVTGEHAPDVLVRLIDPR